MNSRPADNPALAGLVCPCRPADMASLFDIAPPLIASGALPSASPTLLIDRFASEQDELVPRSDAVSRVHLRRDCPLADVTQSATLGGLVLASARIGLAKLESAARAPCQRPHRHPLSARVLIPVQAMNRGDQRCWRSEDRVVVLRPEGADDRLETIEEVRQWPNPTLRIPRRRDHEARPVDRSQDQ